MPALLDEVRSSCAWVAGRARHVRVREAGIAACARTLPRRPELPGLDPEAHLVDGPAELRAAFFLTLDAINFGSGWFPTLRKRDGRSGYHTVAISLRERFARDGAFSAAELAAIEPAVVATVLGQDADHELMALYASSLRDLGARIEDDHRGRFLGVVEQAGDSAVALVERLSGWGSFADVSIYQGRRVPLLKRAQIAAADLALAGVAPFADLQRLTAFADNLVPHVLALDGVLDFEPGLSERIEAGELLVHGSGEEVEMRAATVHAVELLARERADLTAREIDQALWTRGGGRRYKARPRPRCRTTAY